MARAAKANRRKAHKRAGIGITAAALVMVTLLGAVPDRSMEPVDGRRLMSCEAPFRISDWAAKCAARLHRRLVRYGHFPR